MPDFRTVLAFIKETFVIFNCYLITLMRIKYFKQRSIVLDLLTSAQEWILRSFETSQQFLGNAFETSQQWFIDGYDAFSQILQREISLIRAAFQEQEREHFLSEGFRDRLRPTTSCIQFCISCLQQLFVAISTSLSVIFRPIFRAAFDFLYPFVCNEAPVPPRSFWNPFQIASREDVLEIQRDCAFAISGVVISGVAVASFSMIFIVHACCKRRRSEREIGVERSTNNGSVERGTITLAVERGMNVPTAGGEGDATLANEQARNGTESAAVYRKRW